VENFVQDLAAPVTNYVKTHAYAAGPIVFVLCLVKSLAIVTLLVPTLVLLGVGGLAAAGIVDLATLIVWGFFGAGLGYWISYWAGAYYADRIEAIGWLQRRPELVARGHRFFERWGALAVFLSRFIGPARIVVPLFAGTVGVRPVTFHLASWTSAALWVPTVLAPLTIGTWLAAQMQDLPAPVRSSILILLVVGVIVVVRRMRGRA
jgi:membrane protein DedA with SNARE-associated domain